MTATPFLIFLFIFISRHNAIDTQFGMNIHCDESNNCRHQEIRAGIECTVDCSSRMACRGSAISFSSRCDYNHLNCSDYHACYDAHIECPINGYCEFISGYKSMKRATINCAMNSVCNTHCTDIESCALMDIHCAHGSECYVECMHDDSCDQLNIYGQNATVIDVICHGKGCNNLNMYCPVSDNSTRTKCSLALHGNGSQGIEIYAINGLSDVDIINNIDGNHSNGHDMDIRVFCSDEYESFCQISPVTLQCSARHSICNGARVHTIFREVQIMPLIRPTNPIKTNNNDNSGDGRVQNVFVQYYYLILKDKLLTLISVIPLIALICICCSGLLYVQAKKNQRYKSVKKRGRNSLESQSNAAFEGQGVFDVDTSDDDEYNDNDSQISELDCIMKQK